jgi:hypothetical protein
MKKMKLLSKCPACNGALQIRTLQCPDCGLELKNDFELNVFDRLDTEQTTFLLCFLRCRGNLSQLQDELQLSYPAAKKRLSDLLVSLELAPDAQDNYDMEEIDVNNWITDPQSTKASEIIKAKLKEAGGRVIVHSISGNAYEFKANADGKSFYSDVLPINPNYTYEVFDVVVDLLISQGGKARKGLGRNARLGEPNCEENTVVGAIGKRYFGKKTGDSVFDPIFFIAAVLDWAGIAHNERGYLQLTAEYVTQLKNEGKA